MFLFSEKRDIPDDYCTLKTYLIQAQLFGKVLYAFEFFNV